MFVDMYNITFVDMMELKFVISISFTCSFSSVYSLYRWIKKGCQVNGFDNPVLRLCLYMAFCEMTRKAFHTIFRDRKVEV
jgi:hypothetical protein